MFEVPLLAWRGQGEGGRGTDCGLTQSSASPCPQTTCRQPPITSTTSSASWRREGASSCPTSTRSRWVTQATVSVRSEGPGLLAWPGKWLVSGTGGLVEAQWKCGSVETEGRTVWKFLRRCKWHWKAHCYGTCASVVFFFFVVFFLDIFGVSKTFHS